jgi:glycerate 2-kinase
VALLSGGECTVTLRGARAAAAAAASSCWRLARELAGVPAAWAIAADTDGIDGIEDNAGALLVPDTLSRAARLGLDARRMLDDNDGHGFFSALGDLVVTGPTRTNVNDYRAILSAAH